MKCPNCDGELALTKRDGVAMEMCPACKGMWLTRQELTQLEDEVFDFGDDEKGSLVFEPTGTAANVPNAAKPMKRFQYRLYDLDMDFCARRSRLLAGSRRRQARAGIDEERRT